MNNVLPGWIDSLPATEERRAERADAALRHAAKRSPPPSPSSPPKAPAYITGQNIRVDGGLTRSV